MLIQANKFSLLRAEMGLIVSMSNQFGKATAVGNEITDDLEN